MVEESVYPFPTVDVPDHAHYTIGAVILAVGITGMLGNFLVIYAFSRWEEQAEVKLNKYNKKSQMDWCITWNRHIYTIVSSTLPI